MFNKKTGLIAIVVAIIAAIIIAVTGAGSAVAGALITGKDIKDNSIGKKDLSKHVNNLLIKKSKAGPKGEVGAQGPAGANGVQGLKGDKGDSGLEGAYYAVAKYNVGDTNQGAIATVACSSESDVALDGQVQTLGLGVDTAAAAVASSFQGRMDWSTNTPKANRADGWIFQFDAGNAPKKVTLKVLCVPGASIPTVVTFSQDGS